MANRAITFRDGVWSETYPDIAIFDGTYVTENVFASDVVDTEHRRNLYRIIVGAEGVSIANRINDLDRQIRDKNPQIREARGRLEQIVGSVLSVDSFIALPQDVEIDDKIAAKERELAGAERNVEIQRRPNLTLPSLPEFPTNFTTLLGKTFTDIAVDAEERVKTHIARHRMDRRGEPCGRHGRLRKQTVHQIAEGLASAVLSCPMPRSIREPKVELPRHLLPSEIAHVSVHGSVNGVDRLWHAGEGAWVAPISRAHIEREIVRKQKTAHLARAQCDELWLVVAHDLMRGAPSEITEEAQLGPYEHSFDRLLWLEADEPSVLVLGSAV